jgi:O-antigen/teichoic acid export membrane protein
VTASKEVSAGRGVVYLSAAKLYFILVGFSIPIVLPRLLGDVGFGAYQVVVNSVSILNNVMVTATVQAISRWTTNDPTQASAVKAAGLRMHAMVGIPLAAAMAIAAPWIAAFYHDPAKTGPLTVAAAVAGLYAVYSVFVGSANGLRAFHKQGGLDVLSTTLRVSGIFGAAALGYGLHGVMGAWVGAATTILLVAVIWVGPPSSLRGGAVKPMLAFFAQVAVYLFLTNLLLLVDGLLLKRLVAEWYHVHADVLPAAGSIADEADRQVAYYSAAQNLGRLPYQLLLAVTFVIFPLISATTFAGDHEKTRSYVRTTLRYSLIAVMFLGVMFGGNAAANIRFIYPIEYVAAAPALMALGVGAAVGLTMFSIAGTMLTGGGHTRDAIGVALVTVLALVGAIFVLVPRATPGSSMLFWCAMATAGALVLGAVASIALVWRRYAASIPAMTVVRVALGAAAGLAVGHFMPPGGKLIGLVETAACGVAYLVALVATGELKRSDLSVVLRRGKPA